MRKPPLRLVGSVLLNITRRQPDTYLFGELVQGTAVIVPLKCNVQRSTYSQTLMLPESERSKDCLTVFCGEALREQREGTGGWAADTFVWEGATYKVMKNISYSMGVLDHHQVLAVRTELTPN